MTKYLKNIYFWIFIKIHTILIRISISLYNTEIELLKANPDDLDEKNKTTQRKLHRNPLLEKFYAGNSDEKYIQNYYELLKKVDKFIRTSTPHQMAIAADKQGSNYSQKDQYGRRYEHLGFFDGKHKNAGKTIGEVLSSEFEERRTKDDKYEILNIFSNEPIEVGLVKVMDVIEPTTKENVDYDFEVLDILKKSKQFDFPIKATHTNENIVNKIEQLTEFLHIKKIGFDHRLLEFFIPIKYKTTEINEESDIFKDIIDINDVFIKDNYGQLLGFGQIKYVKRINYNNTHEVFKFEGIEMQNVK